MPPVIQVGVEVTLVNQAILLEAVGCVGGHQGKVVEVEVEAKASSGVYPRVTQVRYPLKCQDGAVMFRPSGASSSPDPLH